MIEVLEILGEFAVDFVEKLFLARDYEIDHFYRRRWLVYQMVGEGGLGANRGAVLDLVLMGALGVDGCSSRYRRVLFSLHLALIFNALRIDSSILSANSLATIQLKTRQFFRELIRRRALPAVIRFAVHSSTLNLVFPCT